MSCLVLGKETVQRSGKILGFGIYLKPSTDSALSIQFKVDGPAVPSRIFSLRKGWNRVGMAVPHKNETTAMVVLNFTSKVRKVQVWGGNLDTVVFPSKLVKSNPSIVDLNSEYITPETLYLSHDIALNLDVDAEKSERVRIRESKEFIELKKCSYCGRFLPLDSRKPGILAFHKHNAKRTGHQNECRSCKKWRINDYFNPVRTVDQLHESSAITRERKILLREPEILQRIKDRNGEGLKSMTWERFERKCFNCGKELKLSEVELDHTRPLVYLWPIDVHATCLCANCNNLKKDKFPADFYNKNQLNHLSRICGLPYRELVKREVNAKELSRIMRNIVDFAETWDPRTMNAITRKVREIRPDVDLFRVLRRENPVVYKRLQGRLKDRPVSK